MKCLFFLYLARVIGFDAGVVDELNEHRVAAAQRGAEVDSIFWRWGQSSQYQIVVKVAQIVTPQSQPGCRLARTQRLVLEV